MSTDRDERAIVAADVRLVIVRQLGAALAAAWRCQRDINTKTETITATVKVEDQATCEQANE
jgi:hypothetical protein